jgi:hypothetical protein
MQKVVFVALMVASVACAMPCIDKANEAMSRCQITGSSIVDVVVYHDGESHIAVDKLWVTVNGRTHFKKGSVLYYGVGVVTDGRLVYPVVNIEKR